MGESFQYSKKLNSVMAGGIFLNVSFMKLYS